jgi:hypothetical protein
MSQESLSDVARRMVIAPEMQNANKDKFRSYKQPDIHRTGFFEQDRDSLPFADVHLIFVTPLAFEYCQMGFLYGYFFVLFHPILFLLIELQNISDRTYLEIPQAQIWHLHLDSTNGEHRGLPPR